MCIAGRCEAGRTYSLCTDTWAASINAAEGLPNDAAYAGRLNAARSVPMPFLADKGRGNATRDGHLPFRGG